MFVTTLRFRAIPLAVCLIWLTCESHFSPSFFMANVQFSLAEIATGLNLAAGVKMPQPRWQTAGIGTDGR